MEFFRQEYWHGLPFSSPEDLPSPGTEHKSPALQAGSLLSKPSGEPLWLGSIISWNLTHNFGISYTSFLRQCTDLTVILLSPLTYPRGVEMHQLEVYQMRKQRKRSNPRQTHTGTMWWMLFRKEGNLAIGQQNISSPGSQMVLSVEIQGVEAHTPWIHLVLAPTLALLIWCP